MSQSFFKEGLDKCFISGYGSFNFISCYLFFKNWLDSLQIWKIVIVGRLKSFNNYWFMDFEVIVQDIEVIMNLVLNELWELEWQSSVKYIFDVVLDILEFFKIFLVVVFMLEFFSFMYIQFFKDFEFVFQCSVSIVGDIVCVFWFVKFVKMVVLVKLLVIWFKFIVFFKINVISFGVNLLIFLQFIDKFCIV